MEKQIKIEELKNGEFFKRKSGAKKTYQALGYCRTNKKYEASNYDDINDFIYLKKGTVVIIGFDF